MEDKRIDDLMVIMKDYNYIMNVFISFMLIPDWSEDEEVK